MGEYNLLESEPRKVLSQECKCQAHRTSLVWRLFPSTYKFQLSIIGYLRKKHTITWKYSENNFVENIKSHIQNLEALSRYLLPINLGSIFWF